MTTLGVSNTQRLQRDLKTFEEYLERDRPIQDFIGLIQRNLNRDDHLLHADAATLDSLPQNELLSLSMFYSELNLGLRLNMVSLLKWVHMFEEIRQVHPRLVQDIGMLSVLLTNEYERRHGRPILQSVRVFLNQVHMLIRYIQRIMIEHTDKRVRLIEFKRVLEVLIAIMELPINEQLTELDRQSLIMFSHMITIPSGNINEERIPDAFDVEFIKATNQLFWDHIDKRYPTLATKVLRLMNEKIGGTRAQQVKQKQQSKASSVPILQQQKNTSLIMEYARNPSKRVRREHTHLIQDINSARQSIVSKYVSQIATDIKRIDSKLKPIIEQRRGEEKERIFRKYILDEPDAKLRALPIKWKELINKKREQNSRQAKQWMKKKWDTFSQDILQQYNMSEDPILYEPVRYPVLVQGKVYDKQSFLQALQKTGRIPHHNCPPSTPQLLGDKDKVRQYLQTQPSIHRQIAQVIFHSPQMDQKTKKKELVKIRTRHKFQTKKQE